MEKEEIEKPGLLLGIGCLGLLVNLIGLVLLYGMYALTLKMKKRIKKKITKKFRFYFTFVYIEHGGHHGHSHGGIARSNNKLAQLANTDDNENNSFVFNERVN